MSASVRQRVLVVTSWFSRTGGTEAHVISTVAALRAAGFEITIAAGEIPPTIPIRQEGLAQLVKHDSPGGGVHVLPGLERVGTVPQHAAHALVELVRRVRPDVVHVHGLTDVALIRRIGAESPVAWSIHTYVGCMSGYKYFPDGAPCHRSHGPGCITNVLFRGCGHTRLPRPSAAAYRRSSQLIAGLKDADAVIANSRYLASDLELNGVDDVYVVPLFVDAPSIVSPPPNDGRVLYVGRVTPHKGILTLLKAAAMMDFTLEVCGDGWGMPAARRAADRMGLRRRTNFRGWLSEDQLAEAYERARVVVVPSLLPETFGLSGVEAMAHGRPVIGSATGGIPEWLDDGETGLLVRPGDSRALSAALERLLSDPTRCAEMGRSGRRKALEEFSANRYANRIAEVYEHAVAHWSARRTRAARPLAHSRA